MTAIPIPSIPRHAITWLGISAVVTASCGPLGNEPALPTTDPSAAVVVEVVDGDTLTVELASGEETVRLIGIDTPETAGGPRLPECFGAEATGVTRSLVPPGTSLRLERDVELRDRYGRMLAYAFLPDGAFLNLLLAEQGAADELTIAPNLVHTDAIRTAVASARDERRGLWQACGSSDLLATD